MEKISESRFVRFNKKNISDFNNWYVLDPCGLLEMLTGVKWTVRVESAGYKRGGGDYLVEKWVNGSYAHFARVYKGFNSLQKSNCVNKGKIDSYRVFKVA